MSFEQDLKQTFITHENDVRPDAESWRQVEKKVRRAHVKRLVAASSFAIALIAAAAIVIPRLQSNKPKGFVGPAQTASAPSEPGPPSGDVHVGADQGFRIVIPSGWHAGWWEGVYEYEPAGLPSLARGEDTFAITVHNVPGPYTRPGISGAGDGTASTTINGRRALFGQFTDTRAGERRAVYTIEWPACVPQLIECSPPQNNTLVVIARASTSALWEKYLSAAEAAIRSLVPYDGGTPAHGTVAGSVGTNDFSKALVRFMDARLEGIGADGMMTPSGSSDYKDGLYETGVPPQRYVRYAVTAVTGRSSDKETFAVDVFIDPNEWRTESIIVARTTGSLPLIDGGVVVSQNSQEGS